MLAQSRWRVKGTQASEPLGVLFIGIEAVRAPGLGSGRVPVWHWGRRAWRRLAGGMVPGEGAHTHLLRGMDPALADSRECFAQPPAVDSVHSRSLTCGLEAGGSVCG